MNIITRLAATVSVGTALLMPLAMPALAHAQTPSEEAKKAVCSLNPESCTDDDRLATVMRSIIQLFSWIVGFISVLMVIIGGLKYITSAGDSNKISSAKNTILYALVGLAVVALSQFIVKFVLDKVG